MNARVPSIARRRFLRGAGGFTLALPLLPSLETKVFGADPVLPRRTRFVAFTNEHGGISSANHHPAPATVTEQAEIYPGHVVRFGRLTRAVEGANAQVSAVLKAPASKLTERLVAKMNVMRGLDIPFYIGHQTGGHLGNFVASDQGPKDLRHVPTIDQVMAWSSAVYPDAGSVKVRSIASGIGNRGISFGYSNPAARSGTIQKVGLTGGSHAIFERCFGGGVQAAPSAPARPPIVDRVLESYKTLRTNPRLSAADKQRLDDHLDRFSELQRRLTSSASSSCGKVTRPAEDSGRFSGGGSNNFRQYFPLLNEVLALALMCGASRVATVAGLNGYGMNFCDYGGSWHQGVAHTGNQTLLVQNAQRLFEFAVCDLAARLDVDAGNGRTYLDDTLIQWSPESGLRTHEAQDLTIVTFGSGGGLLKTGLHVDYRNMNASYKQFGQEVVKAGLPYRRWLATALQAMGVPRTEFELDGKPGYGDPRVDPNYAKVVVPQVLTDQSEIVPVLKA